MECLLLCLEADVSQSPQVLGVWDGPGSSQKSRDVHGCVVGMRANHLCLARVQATVRQESGLLEGSLYQTRVLRA